MPSLPPTPTPTRASATWLPAANLPFAVSWSIAAGPMTARSNASPSSMRLVSTPTVALSSVTLWPVAFSKSGTVASRISLKAPAVSTLISAAAAPALPPSIATAPTSAVSRIRRIGLQIPRRLPQRAPHVRRRAAVVAQALRRLAEVAADDVGELLELDLGVRIERVEVVHAHHARGHVPLVLPRLLVLTLDVGLRLVVGAEVLLVEVGIGVAGRLVRVEAQRLVGADRPADFLVDIGLDHLGAPVAMIGADEADHPDVVQQAGEDDLLVHALG